VLDEQLRHAWRARERAIAISPVLRFADEALVLGAGTVLVAADAARRLRSLKGQETRVLALLSAAYGRAIAPALLGNIERAAKCWSDGDACLAYIHLAHAGLPELPDAHEAARRLFMADSIMKAGMSPRAIFEALGLGARYINAIEKLYNPDEPRVPADSGRTSGQWTRGEGTSGPFLLSDLAVPAATSLGDITVSAAESLGEFALRVLVQRLGGPAAAAFGLLFIPSANNLTVEGDVPGLPGLHYAWNRDETLLHLTYDRADGGRSTFSAELEEDVFRDERGLVVGRVLPGGSIAIDTSVVFPDAVNDNEPRLCPLPGLDKPGETGREYEDYVKSIVNPEDTTPTYWGFQLLNLTTGKVVYYDDCQHTTGMMVEAKGLGYMQLLTYDWGEQSLTTQWLGQSGRQLAALGTRRLRWYFAEPEAEAFARRIFDEAKQGRERIETEVLPWTGSEQ
jgi:hypothetical protein